MDVQRGLEFELRDHRSVDVDELERRMIGEQVAAESGKYTASVKLVDRIDRALKKALAKKRK
jgi:secreted trypsin-like serine protease